MNRRTELNQRVLLRRFEDLGGIVMKSRDGHLKLYARGALIGKMAMRGDSASEANKRGLISIRAQMRRSGFDV